MKIVMSVYRLGKFLIGLIVSSDNNKKKVQFLDTTESIDFWNAEDICLLKIIDKYRVADIRKPNAGPFH